MVPLAGLVALALGAVRVAPGGFSEDAGEYRDGDDRDDHQDEKAYYGETQRFFLPCGCGRRALFRRPSYYPITVRAVGGRGYTTRL